MEIKNEREFPDLSFARVLVVDDMPSIRIVAESLMKKYKIQADCVSNGEEALNRIKNGDPRYCVIFMDHLMPGMDGMETVRQIRSLDGEYAKTVPIIAMTGEELSDNGRGFLENGFQAYMAKPLSLAKLDQVLRDWIHHK